MRACPVCRHVLKLCSRVKGVPQKSYRCPNRGCALVRITFWDFKK